MTILTIGFGDLYPTNDVGRGLVFPYSVGGIITLGLVIQSLNKFVTQMGDEKLGQRHFEKKRMRTISRTVTNSFELHRRQDDAFPQPPQPGYIDKETISGPRPANIGPKSAANAEPRSAMGVTIHRRTRTFGPIALPTAISRKPKILLLREEKDRFDEMRNIQHSTASFKKWFALTMSVIAFGILWCVGAVVFWQCEKDAQGMTYFQALYFCYVSLLTIGYGDLSPKSNAGRAFFVVWALIAVPTMTVLISDMGDTVISNFKNFVQQLADFTVLPKDGIWRSFLESHPWLLRWVRRQVEKHAAKKRLREGLPYGPGDADEEDDGPPPDIEGLAEEAEEDMRTKGPADETELSRRLAQSIRQVAKDLSHNPPKRYSYEEWVEFTRLIRFTTKTNVEEVTEEEDEEGLIEWDWIGEDSPMVSKKGEAEFVLDRLCESLSRYMRRRAELKRLAVRKIEGLEGEVERLEEGMEVGVQEGSSGKNRDV